MSLFTKWAIGLYTVMRTHTDQSLISNNLDLYYLFNSTTTLPHVLNFPPYIALARRSTRVWLGENLPDNYSECLPEYHSECLPECHSDNLVLV